MGSLDSYKVMISKVNFNARPSITIVCYCGMDLDLENCLLKINHFFFANDRKIMWPLDIFK